MSRKINSSYDILMMSVLVILLGGCTSPILLDDHDQHASNRGDYDVINAAINVPLAIMASDACKYGAEQDKQKCLAERQAETDELSQAIKNRTKK